MLRSIKYGLLALFLISSSFSNAAQVRTGGGGGSSGGSGTPGGSNTQVQYNSSSAFAGNSGFVYNGANVGIGSASPGSLLDVQGTLSAIASTVSQGKYSVTTATLSGSTANAVLVGNYDNLVIAGTGSLTGAGHAVGGLSYNYFNGSGTLPLQIGAEGVIQNNSTGTVGNGAMVAANMNNMAAGATYTLLAGFQNQISNIAGGATIGTLTDFYSPDFSGVANIPATRYSLFNIDTGKNIYTAGNVGINSANPGDKLDVNGGNVQITNGNVGIGTSPVNAPLEIYGSAPITQMEGNATTSYITHNINTDTKLWRFGSANSGEAVFGVPNKFFLYDSNNTAMRWVVDGAGNMGIGSVNPGQKLDVQGAVRITNQSNITLDVEGTLSQAVFAGNVGVGTTFTNAKLTVIGGNVGIGTWNPIQLFAIANGGATQFSVTSTGTVNSISTVQGTQFIDGNSNSFIADPSGTSKFTNLNITGNFNTLGNVGIGTGSPPTLQRLSIAGNVGIGSVNAGDLFLTTSPPSGGMIIEGNVGIGSITPGQLLDVQGTLRLNGAAARLISRQATAPTVANNDCGTTAQGTIVANSSDLSGTVTVGTLAVTSCAVTFNGTFTAAPNCICMDDSNVLAVRCTATTTKLTVVSTASMSSDLITWWCPANS